MESLETSTKRSGACKIVRADLLTRPHRSDNRSDQMLRAVSLRTKPSTSVQIVSSRRTASAAQIVLVKLMRWAVSDPADAVLMPTEACTNPVRSTHATPPCSGSGDTEVPALLNPLPSNNLRVASSTLLPG